MTKFHPDTIWVARNMKKAASIWMLAFLLFATPSIQAQINTVDGTAFGSGSQTEATTFASVANGEGSLSIGFADTTSITLSNAVEGTITITNNFDTFTITATNNGSLTYGDALAVLDVSGGNELTITGGSFIGTSGSKKTNFPPFPEKSSPNSYSTNASHGGSIRNTGIVEVSGTHFQGATYATINSNQVKGTHGLQVEESTIYFTKIDNTKPSVLIGGDGGDIYSDNTNAYSVGGNGLFATNRSTLVIDIGTFQGGNAGIATTTTNHTSSSKAGNGIKADKTTVTIHDGSFDGGTAGDASESIGGSGLYALQSSKVTINDGTFQGGNGGMGNTSLAGSGVFATNSTINIHGGQLTGGSTTSTSSTGGAGLFSSHSTITISDKTFQEGNSTNSSMLIGGNGFDIYSDTTNAYSVGGSGLFANNSFTLVISNGTFRGGNAGNATATTNYTSRSEAGNGVKVEHSTVTIHDGTFEGGTAGDASESTGGSGLYALQSSKVTILGGTFRGGISGTGNSSRAGHGLFSSGSSLTISNGTFQGGNSGTATLARAGDGVFVTNSTLNIHGGTFTGGSTGTGGIGLHSVDSDLTITGGTFTGGTNGTDRYFGLHSSATASETNTISLTSGTFNWVGFGGEGTQYLTTGTNELTITDGLVLQGGMLIVTNQNDDAFQATTIQQGNMQFVNNFTLEQNGYFTLASSKDSQVKVLNGSLTFTDGSSNFIIVSNNGSGFFEADIINFQTNSTLSVISEISGLPVGTAVTTTVASATSDLNVITASGTNTATKATIEENLNILGIVNRERTGFIGILLENKNLKLNFDTMSLRQYWDATGTFGNFADELDTIANTNMLKIIDEETRNPTSSGSLVEQTYFTTFNTFQTSLNGLHAALGQSTTRGIEFREQLKLPTGAKGPAANNDIRGWAKYYGQFYSRDADGLNAQYDATVHGGVFGVDKIYGNVLLGISGGAGSALTRFENDAEEDMKTYHGALYGTYGADRLYLNGGIAYGHNRVENKTASPFELNGAFDANLISAYFGGGFNLIDTKGGTIFTPEASIQYTTYQQDAYTETSTTAVPRSFDSFDANSLRSQLGINLAMLNKKSFETFAVKVEGRLHWLHEFNPEPDNMSFQLEGGTGNYPITYPLLDEEMFRAGISMTFFNAMKNTPKNVLFRLDLDEFFGADFISHNVAAKVIYAF